MGNPIRHTVRHFMEAGELRQLRKISKEHLARKHSPKSNFVRFLESLENRGGIARVGREDIYSRWTKDVRRQMEEAGTWPSPQQETTISVLAEYLSRLQAVYWSEFPSLRWYMNDDVEENWERMRPYRIILRKIFLKIREKGMRDRSYSMCEWTLHSSTCSWIGDYSRFGPRAKIYKVEPYMPFNNHSDGI